MEYIINTCCAKIGNRDYGTLRAILIIYDIIDIMSMPFSPSGNDFTVFFCSFSRSNHVMMHGKHTLYIQITHVSLVPYQIICKYMYALYDVSIFLKA